MKSEIAMTGRKVKPLLLLMALAGQLQAASPVEVVAAVIIGEAGGEGLAGLAAVRSVIATRARERRQTELAVVTARKKFSCLNSVTPDRLVAIAKRHPRWNAALKLANGPADSSSVGQANHYHTTSVKPYWATGKRPLAVVGNHVFLKL